MSVTRDQLLEVLGDSIPYFAVDGDQRVTHWSAALTALVGYDAEEIIGEHCLKGHRCANCMAGCGLQADRLRTPVSLTLHGKDGSSVAVSKRGRAFFDAAGKFVGGIEILQPRARQMLPQVQPKTTQSFHGIVSEDPAMLQMFQTIRNVSETDATVLLRGESGVGKELFAQAIHMESHRKSGPFVAVNCAALTPSLLESELFGHVRGAFTGAVKDRAGLFQQADGGTLFLDEVAELPLDTQAKLLRVLEERVVTRVGGSKLEKVDVRVISATHRSLRSQVDRGDFRDDLMYRLRVVPLFIPPLRQRQGDVAALVAHFIERNNATGPRRITAVAPDAMKRLLAYPWPGNVRELRNAIEYAFAVSRSETLTVQDLPQEVVGGGGAPRVPSEAERIGVALQAHESINDAADALGMSRATLWRKRKKYGL